MATCKAITGFNQFFFSFLADKFCLDRNPNISLHTGAHPIPFFHMLFKSNFGPLVPVHRGEGSLHFPLSPVYVQEMISKCGTNLMLVIS